MIDPDLGGVAAIMFAFLTGMALCIWAEGYAKNKHIPPATPEKKRKKEPTDEERRAKPPPANPRND